jgi:hypothetical protein
MVPETSVIFKQQTWLTAHEEFIKFGRHANFRSYNRDFKFPLTFEVFAVVYISMNCLLRFIV